MGTILNYYNIYLAFFLLSMFPQRTSLHMAAEGGHIDTVQYLVGKRASIDIKDVDQVKM